MDTNCFAEKGTGDLLNDVYEYSELSSMDESGLKKSSNKMNLDKALYFSSSQMDLLLQRLIEEQQFEFHHVEAFVDSFRDDKNFSNVKNGIWLKEKAKFDGTMIVVMKKFISSPSQLENHNGMTYQQFSNLTAFAQFPCYRIVLKHKHCDLEAQIDYSLLQDHKWYNFFQLKWNKTEIENHASWISELEKKFCCSKPALPKILKCLHLFKSQDSISQNPELPKLFDSIQKASDS